MTEIKLLSMVISLIPFAFVKENDKYGYIIIKQLFRYTNHN